MPLLPRQFMVLPLLLLVPRIWALQVSPNSPCAAICLDDGTKDASDPKNSNTYGSDIVCSDTSYTKTVTGEKFEACISCLQTSSFSESDENDQAWFIYNLRYSLDTCLFGFANSSDPISTPCSTATSCGHLQTALEVGNVDPDGSTYGYCSADNNAFLGSFLSKCVDCLQESGYTQYLTNFIIALQAGCVQQPPAGTVIGIQGSVFSPVNVNITYPGYSQQGTEHHKKGLSQPAIIGIAVGCGIVACIAIAVIFVYCRKRYNERRMKQLTSPLDARFGAKNITSPNNGAYGNPYASPPITVTEHFSQSPFSTKEQHDESPHSRHTSVARSQKSFGKGWQDKSSYRSPPLPPYTGPGVPTHQAYIPEPVLHSPTTSMESGNTIQLSTYSVTPNRRNSPPAPIRVPSGQQGFVPVPIHSSDSEPRSSRGRGTPSPPYLPRVDTRLPPRSQSRAESTTGRRNTSRMGVGNANASTTTPADNSRMGAGYGLRHDFELAERERRARDLMEQRSGRHKREDLTPDSAESEEQWPGAY